MENAVDALKIAFAIFVFVMALSLAMYMFTQAGETADIVLEKSDVTEFMDYIQISDVQNGERIVGLETIIPTLYKYYKENYTVIFRNSDGTPLELYETKTNVDLWSEGYTNRYYSNNKDTKICSFDTNEETRRHEPWTGNNKYYKQNLDMFLSGGTFISPSGNGMDYDYSSSLGRGGFIEKYKNNKFRESLGEYTYNETTNQGEDGTSGITEVKGKEKRVIVYTLIS